MANRSVCAYRGCKNSYAKTPHLTFHTFPENNAADWIVRSGNDSLMDLSLKTLRSKRLCSEHFDDNAFFGGKANGKGRKLKKEALPKMVPIGIESIDNSIQCATPNHSNTPDVISRTILMPQVSIIDNSTEIRDRGHSNNTVSTDDQSLAEQNTTQSAEIHLLSSTRRQARLQAFSRSHREQILLKKIAHLKSRYETAKRIIKNFKRAKKRDLPSPNSIIRDASKYLNSNQLILLEMQLKRSVHKKEEWTSTEQRFAVSLYYVSPKAYVFLRETAKIALPAICTIRRWVNSLNIFTGFDDDLFTRLNAKVETLPIQARDAVLMWDEMSIMKHLEYNSKRDIVEGFEDLGELGRTNKRAKKSLVFMIRGLTVSWKQPVGYFHSHTDVKGEQLIILIKACIMQCFKAGINIRSMVCDQGSNNQRAIKLLGITEQNPFIFIEDKKIYFNWDIPHLYKSIRNRWMEHDILIDGCRVSWNVILELFKCENGKFCRAVPKLSERHVYPNNWDKMRVSLAVQIFSSTVSAALKTGYRTLSLRNPNCMATADFVEHMNDMFDCLNAKSARDRNPLRRGISLKFSQVQEFIDKSISWVNTWEYADNQRELPPCITGLRLSLNAITLLARDILLEGQLYLLTSRLNQDCLENLFGTLRRRSGNNVNPSSMQFRHNLQYCIIAGLMSAPKGSNCIDDESKALNIFSKNSGVTKNMNEKETIDEVENDEDTETDNECDDEEITEELHENEDVNDDNDDDDDDGIALVTPNLEFCAINYVAGYLLNRLFTKFECEQCNKILTKNDDKLTNETELLTFWKAYDTLDGKKFGHLFVPSDRFYKVMKEAYNTFTIEFPQIIHLPNIANTLKQKICDKIVQIDNNCWKDTCIEHRDFIIHLFVRTFIFQNLKWMNREKEANKTKRKSDNYKTDDRLTELKLKKIRNE